MQACYTVGDHIVELEEDGDKVIILAQFELSGAVDYVQSYVCTFRPSLLHSLLKAARYLH